MGLGFPRQKVGDMDFPSPVSRSDRHVALRKVSHLFSSISYSSCIIPLNKYSMMCEYLWR